MRRRFTSLFWNSFVTLKNTSDCSFCRGRRGTTGSVSRFAVVHWLELNLNVRQQIPTLLKVSPWLSRYNSFVMTCEHG